MGNETYEIISNHGNKKLKSKAHLKMYVAMAV